MSGFDPYVNWHATAHGLDADQVHLRRDEKNGALFVELSQDGHLSIRVQLAPHEWSDPEQHAAGLKRDRAGLLRLAGVAAQAAQEIGQLLGLGGGEGQAAEDTRRLDRIRALLARFDWEHDDRQLALEAIERIVDGGPA